MEGERRLARSVYWMYAPRARRRSPARRRTPWYIHGVSPARRIYVDLDDVLSETGQAFIEVLARHFDRRVSFDEIHDFDLGRSFDLSPAELDEFMELAHEPAVLEAMKPIPGAAVVLSGWIETGYRVQVVTGRPPSTGSASRAWLEAMAIPHHELLFVDKYGRGGTDPETGIQAVPLRQLESEEYCLAVEDAAHVSRVLAVDLRIPVALLERPWNLRQSLPSAGEAAPVVRCREWAEIGERFSRP